MSGCPPHYVGLPLSHSPLLFEDEKSRNDIINHVLKLRPNDKSKRCNRMRNPFAIGHGISRIRGRVELREGGENELMLLIEKMIGLTARR